jgi:hypothetical protein
VVWLSHTSSIWPWSGAPKVHLYNTFLGGLHHGSTDYSVVENDSSDSSIKLSAKYMVGLMLLKMLMIGEVKGASLTAVVSLKHLQSNNKVNLNYYSSLDYIH